jgi:hypothetical protein
MLSPTQATRTGGLKDPASMGGSGSAAIAAGMRKLARTNGRRRIRVLVIMSVAALKWKHGGE